MFWVLSLSHSSFRLVIILNFAQPSSPHSNRKGNEPYAIVCKPLIVNFRIHYIYKFRNGNNTHFRYEDMSDSLSWPLFNPDEDLEANSFVTFPSSLNVCEWRSCFDACAQLSCFNLYCDFAWSLSALLVTVSIAFLWMKYNLWYTCFISQGNTCVPIFFLLFRYDW